MTIDKVIKFCDKEFYVNENKEEFLSIGSLLTSLKIYVERETRNAYRDGYNRAVYEFSNNLKARLTDAIYKKDVESMTNLINEIAEELKGGK